jgi:hypothetical protein
MPSSRCVAQDCSNTSDKNAGRSLRKSPNDKSLRRISVRFIQTKHANFYPSLQEIRFMVCSDHFSTDCFECLISFGWFATTTQIRFYAYYLEESGYATNNKRQA